MRLRNAYLRTLEEGLTLMSSTIDVRFMEELERYGEFEVRSCYSCGQCAGTCPLAQERLPRVSWSVSTVLARKA